jgi:hypothetical protein
MKEAAGWGCGIVAFIVGLMLLVGVVFWITNHASLPSDLSQIEQIRADAAVTDPQRAEDVIGQVTVWNQTIASNQSLNRTWYAGWVIPDEWDRVELIAVPR